MDTTEILFYSFIVIVITALILLVVDETWTVNGGHMTGTVIERSYTPSSTRTGAGPVIGGNGGVAVTTSASSEKWTLVCDFNGQVETVDADKKEWVKYDKGDVITVKYGYGLIFRDKIITGILTR